MRWQDMTPGEAYLLATDPSIKVTVLDTPDELRGRARVLVRFETGVTAGRVTDIPSRSIGAPWDRSRAPKRPPSKRRQVATPAPSRPARVGDSVTLADTGELLWTVKAIDEAQGTATIHTVIFDRPDIRTVELARLQVRLDPSRARARRPATSPRDEPPVDAAAEAAERLRPIAPRRELDEIMDDVLFSDRCLKAYNRRLGAGQRGPAVERLRAEVRRRGYLLYDTQPHAGEYARVRVDGRFDIVLARKPTPDAPVTIDALYFPARKRARRRRPRQDRRAA
jgi:hypothetical protein